MPKLGLIIPSSNTTMEPEFHKMLPNSFTVHVARLKLREVTVKGLIEMERGIEEEYDAVSIEGTPKIYEKIAGGVHGDIGTVAMIINMIPKVLNAKPGLVTMKDLPLPSATPEDMRVYLQMKK